MPSISEYTGSSKRTRRILCFSTSTPVKVESVDKESAIKTFSEVPFSKEVNFTLLEYLREFKLVPKQILRRRINEVVRFVNSKPAEEVEEKKPLLLRYINDYLYSQIITIVNESKGKGQINIVFALGLNLLMEDLKPAKKLQIQLNKMKKQLASTGTMTKSLQVELKECYQSVWVELLSTIDKRKIKESKKGILLGVQSANFVDAKGI